MLYACGSNGNGQLGLGHDEDLNDWTFVDLDLRGPISLSGGGNHTVIVELETGKAFGTLNRYFVPLVHPENVKWKLVSCDWNFAYLVDASNRVWLWRPLPTKDMLRLAPALNGSNSVDQPVDADESSLSLMTHVFESPIVQIKSGMRHTVVSLADGKVYGWGASRKGQCGSACAEFDKPNLFIIENLVDSEHLSVSTSIACGRDYTVVLRESQLFYFGPPKFPSLFEEAPKLPLESGWSHILLGGKMYGSNFHNQLEMPESFEIVALGSEHGICASQKTVKTWGWGEHGNCPGTVEFNMPISQVFGGCATSFVYLDPNKPV